MKLQFIRSKSTFCLQGVGNFKVSLKDVSLYCRKERPSDAVRMGHIKALQLGSAKYPFRKGEVKSLTISQGNLGAIKENLFLGQLSKRVVIVFVNNDAYNEVIGKISFNLKHNNINFTAL